MATQAWIMQFRERAIFCRPLPELPPGLGLLDDEMGQQNAGLLDREDLIARATNRIGCRIVEAVCSHAQVRR